VHVVCAAYSVYNLLTVYCVRQRAGDKRYRFMSQNKDWNSAERYCRSESLRLVMIASKHDQKRLQHYLTTEVNNRQYNY